jgi:hypothetical protein
MAHTPEARTPTLAERWCWPAARRDDSRVARRLDHTQGGAGVYRLDEGAWLDDVCPCRQALGVADGRTDVPGPTLQRVMGPCVHARLRSSLQPLVGMARMKARPARLCSDAALLRRVGCKAQPVRPGVCPRGAATRQGPRPTGPIGPEAVAATSVQRRWRARAALVKGVSDALATTGVLTAKRPGRVEATALATTAPDAGGGHGTRTRPMPDQRGQGPALAGTVSGGKRIVWLDAPPKSPWAATVVPIHAPATRAVRAWVPPARRTLAGHARRHKGGCARGCGAGVEVWWLAPQGSVCVVPATANLAVTVDAQAQAAAGAGVTGGRRAPTGRQGQGSNSRS